MHGRTAERHNGTCGCGASRNADERTQKTPYRAFGSAGTQDSDARTRTARDDGLRIIISILALPICPRQTEKEIENIINAIKQGIVTTSITSALNLWKPRRNNWK